MEKEGLFLSGLASVLNAAGSALVNVYDAVMSITAGVVPGEKGNLNARLKEYEKKIENLYSEIGKKVVGSKDAAQTTQAVDDGIKLVAGYRAEIEKIRQSIGKIEEEEKAAAAARREAAQEASRERAAARVKTAPAAPEPPAKPVAKAVKAVKAVKAEEFIVTGIPQEAAVSIEATPESAIEDVPEEAKDAPAEVIEIAAQEPEMQTAVKIESAQPRAGAKAVAEAGTKKALKAEDMETMLKSELLKICSKKKIKANEKMTKDAIIKLILAG